MFVVYGKQNQIRLRVVLMDRKVSGIVFKFFCIDVAILPTLERDLRTMASQSVNQPNKKSFLKLTVYLPIGREI